MTAEDILEEHYREHSKGIESISTKNFPVAYRDAVLAAMKEIAEIAFEAGWNNAHENVNAEPTKETLFNQLFPKEE